MSAPACLRCGMPIEGVTNIGEGAKTPVAGDYSVCFNCGNVARYTGVGFELRMLDVDEEVPAEVRRVQEGLLAFRARHHGDRIDWPCGCVTDKGEVDGKRAFIIRPCSLSCPVFERTSEQLAAAGMPIEIR